MEVTHINSLLLETHCSVDVVFVCLFSLYLYVYVWFKLMYTTNLQLMLIQTFMCHTACMDEGKWG